MIPIEMAMMELEEDLGRVAAWMEHRLPELAPVSIHAILQDEGALFWEIADFAVNAQGQEIREGLAFEEARRCLERQGWIICWYPNSIISAGVQSHAARLSSFDWLNTLVRLEDGDSVFAPD